MANNNGKRTNYVMAGERGAKATKGGGNTGLFIALGIGLLIIAGLAIGIAMPKPQSAPAGDATAGLGTGRPAMYEFSTDT